MPTTKFALFGVGGIGAYHLAAIQRQEALGRARLIAVADPTVPPGVAPRAELEKLGVRWHADYRDLLRAEIEAQAVVIATPIPFHEEMARACVERGVFVNLEKPPVPLIRQLESLIAADSARRVSVGFQMIGSHPIQALKELIVEGRIGEVREIFAGGCWPRLDSYYNRARWAGKLALDGKPVLDGPATNALAHTIHDIMYLAAEGRDEFAIPAYVEGELYRARPIESYDAACLRGRFLSRTGSGSGIDFGIAVTHATQISLPYQFEIRGTHGWARLSNDGARLETSCGIALDEPQTTQQLLDVDYDHLLNVVGGAKDRFRTALADTRGFVAATNGMFVSSGGIHPVDPAFIRSWEGEGGIGFDVSNLREAVQETIRSGKLFSEQGLPWATARPVRILLASLEHRMSENLPPELRFPPAPAAAGGTPR